MNATATWVRTFAEPPRSSEPQLPRVPTKTGPSGATAYNNAIATITLTTLTLAGVYSLSRLFIGWSFAGPVVMVAVGAHFVAWLCRRQGWPPVVAGCVSVLAVIVLVSWSVLPGSTAYGLPLLGTLHAAQSALHHGAMQFHQVSAPAPAYQGFVLVCACGVGALALLADWAAFRMRATLEATVPSFAVFIFCAVLGNTTARTMAIIVEAIGLIAFVVIHQATIDQETSAWFANRTKGALGSSLSAGAVIGLAAVIVALNLGYRLPGATAKGIVAIRSADGGGIGTRSTLSPLVDLRGRLLDPSTDPVFTVQSNQPEYWRETALDSFNGTDWNALSTFHAVGGTLSGGSTPTVGGQTVKQTFSIANLDSPWLPAAYRPVSVTGIKGITYDPQSGNLITNNNALTGATYSVTSIVSSGADEANRLRQAPPASGSAIQPYLQLPQIDPQVIALAHQIVAGQDSEYDKALAIQNYLRNPANFTYSLKYDYTGPDPLYNFLFVAKDGYCQQFAGSYAVLARIVGVPTRLAVGWTWGQESSAGVYDVTDADAHTWPEVYFAGVGWIAFEPTPGRGIPGAQNYTGVAADQAAGSTTANQPTTATSVPSSATTIPKPKGSNTTLPNTNLATRHKHHGSFWVTALLWVGSVLSALALLVGLSLALRWLQQVATRDRVVSQAAQLEADGDNAARDRFARFRQDWSAEGATAPHRWIRRAKAILSLSWILPILPSRQRRGPVRPEVVTRAELLLHWAELIDLLAWWGVRRRASETYREFAHRAAIELRLPLSQEATAVECLLQLAEAATKAEFGLGSVSPGEVEASAQHLAVIKRALLHSASGAQRLRLAVDPRLTVKVR